MWGERPLRKPEGHTGRVGQGGSSAAVGSAQAALGQAILASTLQLQCLVVAVDAAALKRGTLRSCAPRSGGVHTPAPPALLLMSPNMLAPATQEGGILRGHGIEAAAAASCACCPEQLRCLARSTPLLCSRCCTPPSHDALLTPLAQTRQMSAAQWPPPGAPAIIAAASRQHHRCRRCGLRACGGGMGGLLHKCHERLPRRQHLPPKPTTASCWHPPSQERTPARLPPPPFAGHHQPCSMKTQSSAPRGREEPNTTECAPTRSHACHGPCLLSRAHLGPNGHTPVLRLYRPPH